MADRRGEFDRTKSFDSYVVGSANRLAAAAARRAAESPGASYNPLFLYSQSGLGKSHILNAIGLLLESEKADYEVRYLTLERFLQELEAALAQGGTNTMRGRYDSVKVLLLDDVQFIAGQPEAQELLLAMLDEMAQGGAQIVLASDRPPTEIDDLDERLLARFSGGLIVDIGQPDYETRLAIVKLKAAEREVSLAEGVPETLARLRFRNVRDLQGALNRVFANQDLSGRPLRERDVMLLMAEVASGSRPVGPRSEATAAPEARGAGDAPSPAASEPAAGGAADAAPSTEPVAAAEEGSRPLELEADERDPDEGESEGAEDDESEIVDDGPPWRLKVRELAGVARSNSVEAGPLLDLLELEVPPDDWEETLSVFQASLARIREIRRELDRLDNPWPEAAATFLTTTARLDEAENLLASAKELRRPLLPLPEGPLLENIKARYPDLALKAAEQLIRGGPSAYNPLFVHSSEPRRGLGLLRAAGRSFLELQPDRVVGSTSLSAFAEDFGRAMTEGVAGAWRERWWTIDLLLLHELEGLSSTERVQEEVFHLFEAVTRRGGRIILAADRHPDAIENVDARLASRFQGGLVLDLGVSPGGAPTLPTTPLIQPRAAVEEPRPGDSTAATESGATPTGVEPASLTPEVATPPPPATDSGSGDGPGGDEVPEDDLAAVRQLAGLRLAGGGAHAPPSDPGKKRWVPSPENVVWDWPDASALVADDAEPPTVRDDDGD